MRHSLISFTLSGLCLLSILTGPIQIAACAATVEQKAVEQKTPEQAELDQPRLVIKNGSIFMVLDPDGTMNGGPSGSSGAYGLYLDDTRYLSGLTIRADGKPLKTISSKSKDGYKASFNYQTDNKIAIDREIVIGNGSQDHCAMVVERLTLKNSEAKAKEIDLVINFNFDFKDMFEVRGQARKAHGSLATDLTSDQVRARYTGLDNKVLTSAMQFSQPTKLAKLNGNEARYQITLAPGASQTIEFAALPEPTALTKIDFNMHKLQADKDFEIWQKNNVAITCDNPLLNQVFAQAVRDLYVLKITTPRGPAFAAGLPWYSVAFGRDQVITALQILDFAPDSAKQIITLLANYQGKKDDKFTEETPGKIMHELRTGEMARTREIPFIPYYGTVDATPLWLVLVNRYVESTGDLELARSLWPNIEAALAYLKANTQSDFLFYGHAVDGKEPALTNQAWKDSGDSVMHKDGKLAKPPIAICEVQGYLYDAWISGATLAEKLGKVEEATELKERAKKLKEHFKQSFWLPEQNFVALALDGSLKPCSVVTSNAGHLLSSGIIDRKEALAIAERLLKTDMFSGWGIRTLSSQEKNYDPASYHNGSIWPHDNALIVAGMRKHRLGNAVATVVNPLLEVAMQSKDKRLPELFCGYPREKEATPKPYAVSCVPQLWCVGSVFSMVHDLTGLVGRGRAVDDCPQFPPGINWLKMEIPDRSKKRLIVIEINRQGKSDQFTTQVTARQL
ncbi:amylo-alpha-1,6-glucosidase [bacterium]|nr:amylo-alpha-1,6-glucosidase [bacterium]MBP9807258.1 amylo-alpha-1,6-glucosidase [bacterium]